MFSDNFLHLPVRVYRYKDMVEAFERDEDFDTDTPVEFSVGRMALPISEVVSYMDYCEKGTTIKQLNEEGFDSTMVETKTLGKIECALPFVDFERRINEFYETIKASHKKDE